MYLLLQYIYIKFSKLFYRIMFRINKNILTLSPLKLTKQATCHKSFSLYIIHIFIYNVRMIYVLLYSAGLALEIL